MRIRALGLPVSAALAGLALAAGTGQAATGSCDRACLQGIVDQYLDAVIAHDPKVAPLAHDVKFTENGQRLELGDGMWRTLSAKGTYRTFVTDPKSGNVTFLGSAKEADIPVMLALHLTVRNKQVTSIETLIQRNEKSAPGFEKIGYAWNEPVPADERMSHDDLVKTANLYFSGMQMNDGKGIYPFADDCNRIENGTFTTNAPTPAGQTRPDPRTSSNYSAQWSCREQFESGLLHFVSRIRDRRYVSVDPERGLVFAFGFFDHMAGATRNFTTPNGHAVSAGPKQPWTWEIAEAFKIEHGKIHQIQAIMEHVPYGMASGWSTWEQAMSSNARDVSK